jgi:hypothetical protein
MKVLRFAPRDFVALLFGAGIVAAVVLLGQFI